MKPTFARAFVCVLVPVLAGCPAPAVDLTGMEFDVTPFDAVPIDNPGPVIHAPSCAPESVLDFETQGTRNGRTLTITVTTSGAANDQRSNCAVRNGPDRMIRYHVPPASDHVVRAIRVTSITQQTVEAASGTSTVDPTTFDTVLSIRRTCDESDIACGNDAFFRDAQGTVHRTQRSVVYDGDLLPDDVRLIHVDGVDGAAGTALITLEEIEQVGVLGAPCLDVPSERAMDPTAVTAYFRCPGRGVQCRPGAAPDGTDLCLPLLAEGASCDPDQLFDVCDRQAFGVVCALDPSDATQHVCASPGTRAGATCRAEGASGGACDPGLTCSVNPMAGDRDECVQVRSVGEECDPTPRGYINHCAAGLVCCQRGADAGDDTICRAASDPTPCTLPPAMP